MTAQECIDRLDKMQSHIIHGKRIFGDIADVIRMLDTDNKRLASKGSDGWTDPSSIPPDVARKMLAVRDALIKDDTSQAFNRLYSIADPEFKSFTPWLELEKQAKTS